MVNTWVWTLSVLPCHVHLKLMSIWYLWKSDPRRQLTDISGIPVRERKHRKKKSTATVNLYSNFSRKENFCWSVVTWMLIRCPWSQLMLLECSSAICSVTSKHLGRRKVYSVLKMALLRKPYATRILKHDLPLPPQEAQWKPVGFHLLKVKLWQVMCRDVDLPRTLF